MSEIQNSTPPDTSERQTLNIPEVARLLGCSRGSAYRWAREGKLPVLRIGRRMVVPRQAFERWLNSATEPLGWPHSAHRDNVSHRASS